MRGMRFATALVLLAGFGTLAESLDRPASTTPIPWSVKSIPTAFGDWSARELSLTERQYALLETREVLFREYQNTAGTRVIVCVALAAGNRKVAHPPEICYQGQGWTILQQEDETLELRGDSIPVQSLRVRQDREEELVLSWFAVGNKRTSSVLWQTWWGIQAEWSSQPVPVALFRFSSAIRAGDLEGTRAALQKFCSEFVPIAERILR